MEFFNNYSSNTYAGSGNQLYFNMQEDEIKTGRILYKIAVGGEYEYSLLFSNIMDSTYSNGTISHKNLICDSWKIHSARVGKGQITATDKKVEEMTFDKDITASNFCDLTFNGQKEKLVMPGEFFSSDPIIIDFNKNEYLCIEITFSGKMIPYHEESLLPVFVKEEGEWKYSKQMPFAAMIGCNRAVRGRIAYLGDSITQGIGTERNSYLHWNAVLSGKLGADYSYWNLGIGYGRANDAASDGAWLYKAKQADLVFVCFGVNDILQGFSEEQIKKDLETIVDTLKKNGKKVVLQTIPPFEFAEKDIEKWQRINEYIKSVLCGKVDMLFDNNPYICKDGKFPKYGGHPNAEGCAIWADELYKSVKPFIESVQREKSR